MLLIDELDRADDEFEAFLLEVLSDYAVTIPEIGTIAAAEPPVVVITSNRTRELHDALKRRCLYHWIDFPDLEREVEIIRLRAPGVSEELARSVAEAVARLREADLVKRPGAAEAIDWAAALAAARRLLRRRRRGPRHARLGGEERGRPPARGGAPRGCLSPSSTWSASRATCATRASRSAPGGRASSAAPRRSRAPEHLYWAGRATLVGRPADVPAYDAVFARWFGEDEPLPVPSARIHVEADALGRAARASRDEALRRKSFATLEPDELAELAELAARIRLAVPERRTRRRESARDGALDLRRTLRRSFRTGGDPVGLARRRRRRRPRRLVLLVDVSRSMTAYSTALVTVAHAALRADRRWEAFCFGTRLTRVTRALTGPDPTAALERAADEVLDWDGGTRIGDSLKALLDVARARRPRRGRRPLLRRARGRRPGAARARRWSASDCSPTASSGSTR